MTRALKRLGSLRSGIGFFRDYIKYRSLSGEAISLAEIYPCLHNASAPRPGQYFYQDVWALQKIARSAVDKHWDIGSRVDGFVGQCSAITEVEFLDIRCLDYGIEHMTCRQGDILHLPYADSSLRSVSCLHVVEHIGLGRYGDALNPAGSTLAIQELKRVVAPEGNLYFSVPVGRERVCFNAHRVFSPVTILNIFSGLKLVEFSVVSEQSVFIKHAHPQNWVSTEFACGLFHFSR